MTEQRSDEERDATGESRDDRGRLMGVRVDGAWFYRHVPGRFQELRDEARSLRRTSVEAYEHNLRLVADLAEMREHVAALQEQDERNLAELVAVYAVVDSLRGVVQAVEVLADEWISRGAVSVYESAQELGEIVRAALAAAADAPQPAEEQR